MNNKEKLCILTAAIDRAYTAIAETPGAEMKDGQFGNLLYNICHMENIAAGLSGAEEGQREVTGAVGDPNLCNEPSDAGTTKESLAVEAAESEQTPTEDEGETGPEEPTKYTKEEVKSALAKARVKGVNAVAVLRQVGADSFQTLTSNKYAEVMRIIEQELANAS